MARRDGWLHLWPVPFIFFLPVSVDPEALKGDRMNLKSTALLAATALLLPLAAQAQNVAIVNGKAVPKTRVTSLLQQASRGGQQQITPEMEGRARDEVVLREIFAQEAERRGIAATPDYKAQLELLRQTVLIRQLFADFEKKNPATEAEARAEYDRVKAQASGTEYRAATSWWKRKTTPRS